MPFNYGKPIFRWGQLLKKSNVTTTQLARCSYDVENKDERSYITRLYAIWPCHVFVSILSFQVLETCKANRFSVLTSLVSSRTQNTAHFRRDRKENGLRMTDSNNELQQNEESSSHETTTQYSFSYLYITHKQTNKSTYMTISPSKIPSRKINRFRFVDYARGLQPFFLSKAWKSKGA